MSILAKLIKEYGGFGELTASVPPTKLNKYCDSIYLQYCRNFQNATYLKNVEWVLRHYNASKKITLSVLFFTQARYLLDHQVKNLSLYALYYSLFNAFSANIILLPSLSLENTQRISHGKVFNYINNYFVKLGIYKEDSLDLHNELRLMREGYSYHLPLGGSFSQDKKIFDSGALFSRLEELLPLVLQVSDMLSYFSHYAWRKKNGKTQDEYEKYQLEVDQLFFSFIEHHDHLGKYCLIDDDDYSRQAYTLRNFSSPFPISWFITEKMCEDLECGWEPKDSYGYDINEVAQYLAQKTNAF